MLLGVVSGVTGVGALFWLVAGVLGVGARAVPPL
jgi:hypothetical protein